VLGDPQFVYDILYYFDISMALELYDAARTLVALAHS